MTIYQLKNGALKLNRWWEQQPDEIYWLEVTDRSDLGIDLNAPQRRDDGQEFYGYSLINEIRDKDIILHYHKDKKAIIASSKASGGVWEDNVVWGAHGTTARSTGVQPYTRPGWRLGLVGFNLLEPQIDLKLIQSFQSSIQEIRTRLESQYGARLYFPFEISGKRDIRPTQAYLTKFPKDIIQLIPQLRATILEVQDSAKATYHKETGYTRISELGVPYRVANEEAAISERDPFTVDPALVERANRGHASTQNILAHFLHSKGLEPRSPRPDEPNFDLAWKKDDWIFVAEIKSITPDNEEKQLRLGLGQVLRYRHLLAKVNNQVEAILMVESAPTDMSWVELCKTLGVLLIWPEIMEGCL